MSPGYQALKDDYARLPGSKQGFDSRESALDILQQLRANRPELEVEVFKLTRSRLRGLGRNLPGKPRLLNLLNDFDPDFNEEASG
jgi:hypothetical protein